MLIRRSAHERLDRKLAMFKNNPVGHVRRRTRVWFNGLNRRYREYPGIKFSWPVYDIWRYFVNGEAIKLYRLEKTRLAPTPFEQQVIDDLKENGISIIHFDDLFPHNRFSELQALAEACLQRPPNQQRIRAIENGVKVVAKAGKFYLVRLLGDLPVFNQNDKFVTLSLSDEVLRIVCNYLGMLGRLGYIDLWYNVATGASPVLSQRWHRDPDDRKQVKFFLYLRSVNDDNGPFCYIPRSHNGGCFRKIRPQAIHNSNYPPDYVIERNFPETLRKKCIGKAGTLIFCDTIGFHKGGDLVIEGRLLFNAVYTTNAGVPVITAQPYYRISEMRTDTLSVAAQYAVDHLTRHDALR